MLIDDGGFWRVADIQRSNGGSGRARVGGKIDANDPKWTLTASVCHRLRMASRGAWANDNASNPSLARALLAILVHLVAAFRGGLEEGGFVVGRNVRVEYRWGGGDYQRMSVLAGGPTRLPVSVIVAVGAEVYVQAAVKERGADPGGCLLYGRNGDLLGNIPAGLLLRTRVEAERDAYASGTLSGHSPDYLLISLRDFFGSGFLSARG